MPRGTKRIDDDDDDFQTRICPGCSFGTKTLKLDSRESIIIPAVIRTVIPSRIIRQDLDYCKEQEFEPPSERSLHRMIEVCSASMQRSLQDLDNTAAEGTEAFDQISSMLEGL